MGKFKEIRPSQCFCKVQGCKYDIILTGLDFWFPERLSVLKLLYVLMILEGTLDKALNQMACCNKLTAAFIP